MKPELIDERLLRAAETNPTINAAIGAARTLQLQEREMLIELVLTLADNAEVLQKGLVAVVSRNPPAYIAAVEE